ncbi:DegT/DnrJ/EryC1/StrS family aminotransferase [Pseudothermotoga thermarum]|uniref:DegT/DnrJ/EryC1/StrS aminotransferase n=1 Tax=Pseudothermotoga thermarum DSM 5069 TaxID=688269 RepID=F7YWP3_9THEM|nr:DegT/DnrJ/EryC1/StrS family aminotransferase [Pseudothermotoga thermarum]AEH52033.1 DegT/DnrJ/EryC1/StrS aminotransferase [Pseudothermotoga thermarum DSM 5069]
MKVPLFDLTRQYQSIRSEILNCIDEVLKSGRVILGPNVERLENEIASYIGVRYAIGVANGSDALYIAVKALNIGEGDLVITTPFTFFATVSCITRNRASFIFADIDEETFNVDLNEVEKILQEHPNKERIKAFIPVHLFGRTIDLERLENIKNKYGLKIIEDCAQSIGSEWTYSSGQRKKSGSVGDLAILSFFPTKNLGAYGDGGMILTNDEKLAEFCKVFRVHGAKVKYFHEIEGINSRLDEIQAAILRVKMKYLDDYHRKRIEIARKYNDHLKDLQKNGFIVLPKVEDGFGCVFHQYVVRVKNGLRDSLKEFLKQNGVETAIYYPLPMHKQKCFEKDGLTYSFPKAEKACQEVLALPMFPELLDEEIEYVSSKILEFFKGV